MPCCTNYTIAEASSRTWRSSRRPWTPAPPSPWSARMILIIKINNGDNNNNNQQHNNKHKHDNDTTATTNNDNTDTNNI